MDIRHLRYFVSIAESGSLMKASERLHVAQPALSVHISNLETELGAKLLQRSNRGVELTEEGRFFYARAKGVLRDYQDIISTIQDRQTRPIGTVSIGMPSTTSPLIAADLYCRVRENCPDVTLYISDASTAVLYEWVLDGRIDFAILFSLPDDSGLDLVPLSVEEFCLVSRADGFNAEKPLPFAAIFDVPLVMPCKSTTWRKIIDDFAEKIGREVTVRVETESVSVMKAIILAGEASALLPRSSVIEDVACGLMQVRPLVDPAIRGVLSLASRSDTAMTPAKRAVRDMVIDIFNRRRSPDGGSLALDQATPILRTLPDPIRGNRQQDASSRKSKGAR